MVEYLVPSWCPPPPHPYTLRTLLWNFENVGPPWRKRVTGGLLVLCLAYSRGPLISAWTLLPVAPKVTKQPQMPATLDRKTPIATLSPLQWERAPPPPSPKYLYFTIVRREPRTSRMLGEEFTRELYPQPALGYLFLRGKKRGSREDIEI